jgi:hypothetical protein
LNNERITNGIHQPFYLIVAQSRLCIALEWSNALWYWLIYRLALTPDALQGRVNSIARLISFGLAPLSIALTGILLQSVFCIDWHTGSAGSDGNDE